MKFGGWGKAEALNSRAAHFPAIGTTKTICHVLVRLQFGFVIIPLHQKEVMHTRETPNHHVRRAINHLLLNIKRTSEHPVGKQGFWKALFSPQSLHFNLPCFYFGRGRRKAQGFMHTAMNENTFVPCVWLMADCKHWSMPSWPSGHCCYPCGSRGAQKGLSSCSTSAFGWKHRAACPTSHLFYLNWWALGCFGDIYSSPLFLPSLSSHWPPAPASQSCAELQACSSEEIA